MFTTTFIFLFSRFGVAAFFSFTVLLLYSASTTVLSHTGLSTSIVCSVWSAPSATVLSFPGCQLLLVEVCELDILHFSQWCLVGTCSDWIVEYDAAFSICDLWFSIVVVFPSVSVLFFFSFGCRFSRIYFKVAAVSAFSFALWVASCWFWRCTSLTSPKIQGILIGWSSDFCEAFLLPWFTDL